MPKHKKTREQKIAASLKHQQQPQQFHYSLTPLQQDAQTVPHTTTLSVTEGTVAKDLQKTLFISVFLIACEVIFYILLHKHLLKVPWTLY